MTAYQTRFGHACVENEQEEAQTNGAESSEWSTFSNGETAEALHSYAAASRVVVTPSVIARMIPVGENGAFRWDADISFDYSHLDASVPESSKLVNVELGRVLGKGDLIDAGGASFDGYSVVSVTVSDLLPSALQHMSLLTTHAYTQQFEEAGTPAMESETQVEVSFQLALEDVEQDTTEYEKFETRRNMNSVEGRLAHSELERDDLLGLMEDPSAYESPEMAQAIENVAVFEKRAESWLMAISVFDADLESSLVHFRALSDLDKHTPLVAALAIQKLEPEQATVRDDALRAAREQRATMTSVLKQIEGQERLLEVLNDFDRPTSELELDVSLLKEQYQSITSAFSGSIEELEALADTLGAQDDLAMSNHSIHLAKDGEKSLFERESATMRMRDRASDDQDSIAYWKGRHEEASIEAVSELPGRLERVNDSIESLRSQLEDLEKTLQGLDAAAITDCRVPVH